MCQGEHCCTEPWSSLVPECGHSKCRNEKDDFLFSEAESHKLAPGLLVRVSPELKVMYLKAAPSLSLR